MAEAKTKTRPVTLARAIPPGVRESREIAGMTQEALAGAAKLSIQYVNMIENGRRTPSVPVLDRIAKACGVTGPFLIATGHGAIQRGEG